MNAFVVLKSLQQLDPADQEAINVPYSEKLPYGPHGDLLQDVLYVNPEHQFQEFAYPVFKEGLSPKEMIKGEYHVFFFRHPKTQEVQGISITPFYRKVLECLIAGNCTGKEAIMKAAQQCSIPIDPRLYEQGRAFCQEIFSQEGILGFQ